jgi:osmotically-inducible protein OsmY
MKTDTQLRDDVQAEIHWTPEITAADIGVSAKDGVVTLTGHLASHAEKLAAENAARRVHGVKALAVEMTVRLPFDHQRTDADIGLAAERALAWNALVPDDRVQATIEGGWLSLTGEVEWDYQRRAAEHAVRDLMGVTGVTNLIEVTPRLSPADVEHKIQAALARQADREARRLSVTVEGARVTLRGQVHSWAERDAAQGAAWSTPGVSTVIDELVVVS